MKRFIVILVLLTAIPVIDGITCTTNCLECFGTGASECLKCHSSKKLQRFACVDNCDSNYIYDSYDNTCKKSRYKYEHPCSKGYYNALPQRTSSDSCISCPAGSYCPGLAYSGAVKSCEAGYYCLTNAYMGRDDSALQDKTKYCPIGSYCPSASSAAIACPAGSYCDRERLAAPTGTCAAGYICYGSSTTPRPTVVSQGEICPAGYYCPAGASEKKACPAGKYLNSKGASADTDCLSCPPGKYCASVGLTAPSGDCTAGYYCPAGTTSATPAANYCPTGHYCPTGSAEPIPCAITDYQDEAMQATCKVCPTGYYCEDGNSKKQCPTGSYCPGNNVIVNCPQGKYRSEAGGQSASDCSSCPAGYACETPGLSNPVTTCAAGYYCLGETKTRFPTNEASEKGDKCTAGTYCAEQSSSKTTCTAGYYCPIERLAAPTAKCQAGYYCTGSATTSTQTVCPAGKYCPEGSANPSPCPIGTYGPLTGASIIGDCVACDYGKFCEATGMSAPNVNACSAGFYCDQSQSSQNPPSKSCPKGNQCPTGAVAPDPCRPGTYQPNTGQSTCLTCPEGYYCDGTDTSEAVDCPRGYYCPTGTVVAYQHPCAAGKYRSKLNGKSSSDCSDCAGGYYCPTKGMSSYSAICSAGYVCTAASPDPNPTSAVGYVCPSGYYCPAGSSNKAECPSGTFYDGTKAIQDSDCQKIKPGYFCNQVAQTSATLAAINNADQYGPCKAGYICKTGSYTSAPTSGTMGTICSEGYYCPSGTTYQILCAIGTYNGQKGQGSCTTCPAGKFCKDTGMNTPASCTSKYYCPAGSGYPTPCPPGTYSSSSDLSDKSECDPCPGGSYCELPATDSTSNKCAAGYVCQSGSADQKPCGGEFDGFTVFNGYCPKGSYCLEGSAQPTVCPKGKYQDAKGATICKTCPNGYGCSSTGIKTLTSAYYCEAGYFCMEGATTLSPTDGTTGTACPIGFYCPAGSPNKIRCADGTYQPNTGQGTCIPCPAGKICYYKKAATEITIAECPLSYYCEAGSGFVGKLCEPGYTSSSSTGLKATTECNACGAGVYCVDAEKDSNGADSCAAGYFCGSGASSPTPATSLCSAGFYCSYGTTTEVQCPSGKFRKDKGARCAEECSICQPGQYCTRGNPVPVDCPTGSYCPLGASTPVSCPTGTYNDVSGAEQRYNCKSCPAGYYCQEEGLATYLSSTCPASSYCLERATVAISCLAGFYISGSGQSASDCNPCSAGYYCPSGTSTEIACGNGHECPSLSPAPAQCEGGYYCTANGATPNVITKTICPAGYYCKVGSSVPVACPTGYICPQGSIRPVTCGYGSFLKSNIVPTSVTTIEDACEYCVAGYYAASDGCKICPAGYVCLGKTLTKYPVKESTDNGYECPAGYYCLEGSIKETACPAGTYRSKKKGKSLSDCLNCPENTFNDKTGQSACKKCGPSATSEAGNHTCTCVGKNREFFKSDSSCRCISGFYQEKYGIKSEQDDSTVDCEPKVYDTCSNDEIYNYKGECVSKTDCSAQCENGGSYSESYGVCICSDAKSIDDICGATCRSGALKMQYNSSGIYAYNPNNTNEFVYVEFNTNTSMYTEGIDLSSISSSSSVKSVNSESSGFAGTYGVPTEIENMFYAKYPSRRLLVTSSSSISAPIYCATVGETIAFGVSATSYPIYLKDSLINTVKNFDYGPFVTLADKITKTGSVPSVFLFQFSTAGTYLFGTSSDSNKQMVVHVATTCTEAYTNQMTESVLAQLGVYVRDDVIKDLQLWIFMLIACLLIIVVFGLSAFVYWRWNWMISWIYGQDLVTVMDKKKAGEPDEEEDEMEKLMKKGEDNVDGLFFVYLKQKLNEMDEKMRGLLAKANISSIKKLQKLADKINRLKEIFNEHVGALIMPNGMTIDEYIKAHEDQLAQDSSDYSSIIDESDERSSPATPREKKEEPKGEEPKEEKNFGDLVFLEPEVKPEKDIEKDIQRESEKVRDQERETQEEVRNELERRKKEYQNMVLKHGAGGNINEVQDYLNDEMEKLNELQNRLSDELSNQNAGLQDKLMRRQEKKLKANEEVERLRKEQEEIEAKRRVELEKMHEEQKAEIEAVDKETENERERGKQLIEKTLAEQLAEQHARFIQQFAVSPDKDKLLARHEGETQRLKEHLESEKRRQERDLDNKLEQRSLNKKREIMGMYKSKENVLTDKYDKMAGEIEARKAVIEGDVPASEEKFVPFIEQLEADRKRLIKQQEKEAQGEDIVMDSKKRGESDAIEKEYQLEERKAYIDNRQEIDDLLKKEMEQEKDLKERFTREVKSAPTSKERNEILAQYEKSKKELKTSLETERKKVEDRTEERLAERRRNREQKRIQLEARLEQEKRELEKKNKENTIEDIDHHTDQAIEQLISQAIAQNNLPLIEVPVLFEYLVRGKLNQNLSDLKKSQFADLSQQLSSLQTQLMKEKYIDISAVKDGTEKKIKDLEKKSMSPEQYQKKLERIQRNEAMKIEAINANYENKGISHESRIRNSLANQNYDEQIKLINKEETARTRLLDRVLRKYNSNGDIPLKVIEELNTKKAQDFNEMREDAQIDRDKKLQEAQNILGDMNQEELKEMEKKYEQEIEAESKQLDKKLKEDKKRAIEQRKKQYEDRLSKIPAISIDQRKQLMAEHQRELDKLEKAMSDAREDQLKKLKEKLINKKIQQERLRARAEHKTAQKMKEKSAEPIMVIEGVKEDVRQAKPQKTETKMRTYAYKPLLKQWVQKVEEKKGEESKSLMPDPSLLGVIDKSAHEEAKGEEFDETEGAYVNMKELFETVLNCYDLSNTVQDFEFPEIARGIEKLTYFMDAILKGGKRLTEANISRLGAKMTQTTDLHHH